MYCDLEKSFSTGTKGWVRVANLNMTDPNQQCPLNFSLYTQPKRLCGRKTDGSGCDSIKFTTNGLQYNKVCGRKGCSDCQVNRPMPVQVPLHPWEWPAQPWTRLHLDYAGPFMERMFLILSDSHSKWMDVIPVKSATSAVTIQIEKPVPFYVEFFSGTAKGI